jgi:hypothetical protein
MPKDEEKKKIKIKWTMRNNAIAIIIVLAVAAAYVYLFYVPKPVYSVTYNGAVLNFRVDLREATKVPVRPGVSEVASTINSAWVQNITIVYKQSESNDTAKYYNIEAFEIANKLKTAMLADGIDNIGIDAKPLSQYNRTDYVQLPGQIQHPLIAIIPPEFANETLVYAAPEHVVYISATSDKDLDLAVARFLMSVFRIEL